MKLIKKIVLLFCLFLRPVWAQTSQSATEGDQLLKLAGQLMQKQKLDLAKNMFAKAREKGANPVIVRYNLAYIHYKQKNFGQAIKDYQYCINNAPAFRSVYQSLALLYNSLDCQRKGIAVLQNYMDRNGQDATFYVLMGDLYLQIQATADADRCYQKSLKIDPSLDLPYISVANLYVGLGDAARALQVIELGIPVVKDPTELLLKKIDILAVLENFMEAAGTCSLVLELYSPKDDQRRYNLMYAMANFYLDAGLGMLSIDILKDCIDKFPDRSDTALDLLEYTFLESGLYAQAIQFYDEYFEKNRKKIYGFVRRLSQKVLQEKNQSIFEKIIQFYEKYKLRDDTYSLLKENSNVIKGKNELSY